MTYECERCPTTTGDPTSMIEHARTDHGLTTFAVSDLRSPIFVSQYEAQKGVRPSAVICCRSCARDTQLVDGQWRHCDDDTLACLNPDTLKPYNPKESTDMSPATATKPRLRPSKAAHRAVFSNLDADARSAARALVSKLVDDEGVSLVDAWTVALDLTPPTDVLDAIADTSAAIVDALNGDTSALQDVVDAVTAKQAASSRVERIKLAKAERAAVKAAEAAGEPRPATPNLDALEAGEPASTKSSSTASKPKAVTGTQYVGNGKVKRGLSSIAYDFTKGCTSPDSPRMSVTELRAWLAAEGVTEPDTTTWERTLPNGITIGVTVPKGAK